MPTRLDVYRVFLASPSDVQEERSAALDLQNRLNATLMRKHGSLVVFTIWEHVEPAVGRPQEIINQLVDDCDIFVGLLHERWGSPTGKWSSGFEEEFRRAERRHAMTGTPEIGLFFKPPTPAATIRAPDEVKKVLDFRDSIGSRYLYRDVVSLHEWKEGLSFLLLQHAVPTTAESERRGRAAIAAEMQPERAAEHPRAGADLPNLEALLSEVTERQAAVLRLRYVDGLSQQQVSELLNVPLSDVKTEQRRGLRALRRELDRRGD